MNKSFILVLLIAVAMGACSKETDTTTAERKTIVEAVYASGNVYPKSEYKVYANADGFLSDIFMKEGDKVKKNQLILQIENDMQNVRAGSAYEIYNTALRNYSDGSPVLKELEANLNNSKLKLYNDSLNFTRYKNLYESRVVALAEYEKFQLAYDFARNDYKAKKLAYEKLKNQLYVDLKNAESAFKVNAKDRDNFILKSLMDGTVYEIFRERGEAVRRNEPIALIGSSDDLVVQLSIDELDISKVAIGQEVLIKVDAYQGKVYKAKITRIYPKLNKQDQSFRVDAEFVDDKPVSYYGITVEANIIINRKEDALVVPKTLIVGMDSLMVKKDGEVVKVKVKKGIENIDSVEILEGISEESQLVVK